MDEMSAQAKAILNAGRANGELEPSHAKELEGAFARKVGMAAFTSAVVIGRAAPVAAGVAGASLWKSGFAAKVILAAAVTAGAVTLGVRARHADMMDPSTSVPPPHQVQSLGAETTAVETPAEPPSAKPAPVSAPTAVPRAPERIAAPIPGNSGNLLNDEVTLIAKAQAAVAGHKPNQAIAALDEHARRFPHGQLKPERESLRVMAGCELGRSSAIAQGKKMVAARPDSGLSKRIAEACKIAR